MISLAMLAEFRTGRTMPRPVVLAIIACALVMRMLVPQGWMPVHAANGWTITICTGAGPMKMTMADGARVSKSAHQGSDSGYPGKGDHSCAFSSFSLALDVPPPPAVALPAPIAEIWRAGIALAIAVGRGLAAPPPPSTGPPILL